jgi:hypothetical protein
MRKSDLFLIFCAAGFALLAGFLVHGALRTGDDTAGRNPALEAKKRMVAYFTIGDLCLFTDARYTRHISQADLHTPFQDHPVALDYFPSGSLVPPPATLRQR